MPNRLADETSPYLLQHANNPVDWYPWGDEALQRARVEDKPILLSVGYSACHWCHVMERESFENPAIAAQMNQLFVSVKVDREERPDIDSIYMTAVQAMTGHGGWPMTVFLTPDGKPFYGGTYFPPEDRGGMPSFPRVMEAISDAYSNNRDEVLQNTEHPAGPHAADVRRRAAGLRASDRRGHAARDAEGGERLRPQARRVRLAAQVPAADDLRVPAAALPADRGLRSIAYGRADPTKNGNRRHIRPDRRRISPLFDRRVLARAALREDAVRQRPARSAIPARLPDYRQSDVQAYR